MQRSKHGITNKLLKFCYKKIKKSLDYTRLLTFEINDFDFDINLIGTNFEEYGLKFLKLSCTLDNNKDIKINYINYYIDVSYLIYFDNVMSTLCTFHITSLDGLKELSNEELDYLFNSNVSLECVSDRPILIFSDIECVDYDLNLSFIDKIKTLYESNICLKGTFRLKLSTIKLSENNYSNINYIDRLISRVYEVLIHYSDFTDILLDLRSFSNSNFYSAFLDDKEKSILSNYVFDYVFRHINELVNPYNTSIRFIVNNLDKSNLEYIKENILNIVNDNIVFSTCDTYMSDKDFMINVVDYINILIKDKKFNRQKNQIIHII